MKKVILIMITALTVFSCKKDNKKVEKENSNKVVLKNEKANATDDSIAKSNIEDSTKIKLSSTIIPEQVAVEKGEDGKYSYKYNLEVGKTYPMTLTVKNTHSATDGKESQKVSNESKKRVEYTVKDYTDGIYTLEVKSTQYSERVTDPSGKSISFDTNAAKPTNKDIAISWSIYKAMTKKSYTMKVDQKGKVLDVKGLDNIKSSIINSVKKQVNAEEFKFFSQLINNSLNKEVISGQFEESMNIFPKKSLSLKESWSDNQKIDQGSMKGNVSMKHTLESVEPSNTTITITGSQNMKGSDSQQDVKMSVDSNSNVDGKILIDTKSGWINKVFLTKKETLKRTVEGQGQKQSITEASTTVTTIN